MRWFAAVIMAVALSASAAAGPVVSVAFYKGEDLYVVGREVDDQPCPTLAAAMLLQGLTAEEVNDGVESAIPAATSLVTASVDAQNRVHIDVSRGYLDGGTSDARIEAMGRQWFATFRQFPFVAGVVVTVEGRPLDTYLKPAVLVERAPDGTQEEERAEGLAGREIAVSPGHGIYWNGSSWYYQRPAYCGYENEDLRNLKLVGYLRTFLENHGATVRAARQTDQDDCCSQTGDAWWRMASPYWLKHQGYPASVYANYTGDPNLGSGASERSDDIRARPLMSDYHDTDVYVSVHTNGFTGDCYGTCPSGTETYYDSSPEHAAWGDASRQLAEAVNPSIVFAINTALPEIGPDWSCHGACVKDSYGNYGEIRIPDRAAILTELGFHDTCDRDALLMNDNFFRSVAMWGVYKGICNYFGDTPTPLYHAEYVDDDIPAVVSEGEVRTVHITFRNQGAAWSEERAFRLGAVGDSDPFAAHRQGLAGEVGPGETCTFTFEMDFGESGDYTTDWRMVRDGFAWFGDILSRTVQVLPETSIFETKSLPNGSAVRLVDVLVSGVFDGFFYVQEPDRSSGIRVGSTVAVQIGDTVAVTGAIGTTLSERYIAATIVTVK